MKITLKLDAKPIKKRLYRLNPKYKEKVRLELDKMLESGIIELVEESDWVSPMVVQEKKQKGEIRIFVDLRKLNDACVHDPFSTPFIDEIPDHTESEEVSILCPLWDLFGSCRVQVRDDGGPYHDHGSSEFGGPKKCQTTMHNTREYRYYEKFIKAYPQITMTMEKLLKKDATFCWDEECQCNLDVLKEEMVTVSILVFSDWKTKFHIHVDASCTALGKMLTQVGEGEMEHPIAFARKKLLKAKNNY
eukprot:PITA_13462